TECTCAFKVNLLESPGPAVAKLAGNEVARVKGLERMPDQNGVAGGPVRNNDRLIDHVEELANRDRRRAAGSGALGNAGVGDDQSIRRREQGVEQQLSVLHSGVPFAQLGVEESEVITVPGGVTRKGSIV